MCGFVLLVIISSYPKYKEPEIWEMNPYNSGDGSGIILMDNKGILEGLDGKRF